jgi:heterodisulfide reductase subunit A2
MITFKLDGKTVQGEEGQYILQVAQKYGIEIPTLCHHKALEPAGMCRLCTVELFDGRGSRYVTACNHPIREDMEVRTDSEAVHRGRKLIVELLLARCPEVPTLRKLAERYGIVEPRPRFKKEGDDCILCGLCTRICQRMGNSAISLTGRGVDMKVDTPFHRQTEVCLACGACASVCPTGHIKLEDISKQAVKQIPSEYDMGLKGRKPIYVPYAQAIPNTPAIDRSKCIHFKTGACKICTEFCGLGAIDHEQQDEIIELNVGAVILANGSEVFDPSGIRTWGYGAYPNVITALQMERILSASGPTQGHLVRPSDHQEVKHLAFLQCVGSRDLNKSSNGYCSSVCCTYAVKEAMIAKEHVKDLDVSIFFMDMRTYGKDFERFYQRAKESGVEFKRSRIHSLEPVPDSGNLYLRYINEVGKQVEDEFEMVVLSTGLCAPQSAPRLAELFGIELNKNRFAHTLSFNPVATTRPGIFTCGTFSGPKDIPQTVMEASAASAEATQFLVSARNTLTRQVEYPPERDVNSEPPSVGVFICHCGSNIAGVVDVEKAAEYARTLPHVRCVERNLFTCSQDSQELIKEKIRAAGLNRIVVAACTPRTHEALFRETLKSVGLNEYLFEMANIRNQDSWVHADSPAQATQKAMDLIRMAVVKVNLLTPLSQTTVGVHQTALVIGGGLAGMISALEFANHGFPVHLVEKSTMLGGNARHLFLNYKNEPIAPELQVLESKVRSHPHITLHMESTVVEAEGFVGNFKTRISSNGASKEIEHGVGVLATGGQAHMPTEYGFGHSDRIFTSIEFDKLHMMGDRRMEEAKTYVFIQCVGSREPDRMYCSKVCCTHSVQSAIELKKEDPEREIFVLYRDIRTYGEREDRFKQARELGVVFVNYEFHEKPKVVPNVDKVEVVVWDHVLHEPIKIISDILVLATAIVPNPANEELARIYKLSTDRDGFLAEAHQKLRPVDSAADGLFLAGLAHYPKPIEETIAQAQAAAGRGIVVLAGGKISLEAIKATVVEENCDGCALCLDVCPYGAISLKFRPMERTLGLRESRSMAPSARDVGFARRPVQRTGFMWPDSAWNKFPPRSRPLWQDSVRRNSKDLYRFNPLGEEDGHGFRTEDHRVYL